MKFANPWIDPRVELVRTQHAEDYLRHHGWQPMPFPRPEVRLYGGPVADSGQPITQMVPANEQGDDYLQCIIDLITNIAILEDRPAVAVLEDILPAAPNGPPRSSRRERSRSAKTKQ